MIVEKVHAPSFPLSRGGLKRLCILPRDKNPTGSLFIVLHPIFLKPSPFNKLIYLSVIIILISLSACDRDNNSTGYTYFPDMVDSRAYEAYSENPNFADRSTMRQPPEGTIARGYMPLPYTKDLEDRTLAGKELKNPYDYTEENLARGKVMFERICFNCHGPHGDGKGYLYTSGLFPFPPASLVNRKVDSIPDGEIFHTITYGYGVMGAHGSIVRPDDRWKIILYIRKELQGIK